ncbi:hypothetical protein EDD75_0340 [Thermodesulfitimonas autotrophica]|uniref:Uncharacterized protein n=1 Tax=Thermodesulfitimonas autotrophica TaxID=1894989 RepID=A0A3N5AX09_9THEO|nr:hypothetical protein [Thermodesulfitimonas autotrophica]RPF49524.1 hypothetical protein EDD75_0340 [Thermodesulfitimonas autotrophica]
MRRKGLKRLELRLPVTHWIWRLSEGSRAATAVRYLEIGARLEAIEERMARLERKIDALSATVPENTKKPASEKNAPVIDAAAFFDI